MKVLRFLLIVAFVLAFFWMHDNLGGDALGETILAISFFTSAIVFVFLFSSRGGRDRAEWKPLNLVYLIGIAVAFGFYLGGIPYRWFNLVGPVALVIFAMRIRQAGQAQDEGYG